MSSLVSAPLTLLVINYYKINTFIPAIKVACVWLPLNWWQRQDKKCTGSLDLQTMPRL